MARETFYLVLFRQLYKIFDEVMISIWILKPDIVCILYCWL